MFKNLFLAFFLFALSFFLRTASGYIINDGLPVLILNCVSVISSVLPFLIYRILYKTDSKKRKYQNSSLSIPIFFSALLLANIGAVIESFALNFFEISLGDSGIPQLGAFEFLVYILFSAFFAPVAEEYIFRKNLFEILSEYGVLPSLIISSLMFCAIHPFGTKVYAFIMGIAFCLIFMRCGFKYSVIFHILNNSLNIILSIFQKSFGTKIDIFYNVFVLTAGILSAFVIIKKISKGGGGNRKET